MLGDADYCYEVRGEGKPVLLLHGELSSGDVFDPILPLLCRTRKVITIDLRGHGRTTLGNQPIRCEAMADDAAEILVHLGLEAADVLGHSMGGCVALCLATQHPKLVRRMVLVSTPFSSDGWHPDTRARQMGAAMASMMKESSKYGDMADPAERIQNLRRLLDAVGDWVRHPFDWSPGIARSVLPTMLIFGDSDAVRSEHRVRFHRLLGGGLKEIRRMRESTAPHHLAVLSDTAHYDIASSSRMADVALKFLDGLSAVPVELVE